MDDFLQLSFEQISHFHFVRPDWLWAIAGLIAVWLMRNQMSRNTQWRSILPPHLAKVLLANSDNTSGAKRHGRTLLVFWLLTSVALAGPTWQKIEKPVFQVKRASVILLDMSLSMRSTDLKPNRLSRSRFKAIDLAEAIGDGEVALVAYAGDAFTISPLTPDARNLTALIPSLTPEIMPEPGSYPLLGLERSAELLTQAGYLKGDIFWFTDGIDEFDLAQLRSFAAATPYRINIIAFGTASGAPIKLADGSLMKDDTGSIVIPKLNTAALITVADMTNGLFVTTTANDTDIKTLASLTATQKPPEDNEDDPDKKLTGDDWHEFGPYLALLILPLILSKFRRGAALSLLFAIGLFTPPKPAFANSSLPHAQSSNMAPKTAPEQVNIEQRSWLDSMFKRSDKHGQEAYNNDNYAQAAADFEHQQWKGSAAYKAKDYETALNYFNLDDTAGGFYNRGNALAQLQRFDEAIEAYDETLRIQPSHEQAAANKALLEKMQEQQEQQNEDSEQQDSEQQSEQEQQDGGQEENSEDQQQSEGENQSDSQSESKDQQSKQDQQQADPSAEPQDEQQQGQQQSESEQQEAERKEQEAQQATQSEEESDQQPDDTQQAGVTPLTAEQVAEQEQQQKIEQLLRKVSDDPATLLRNKMILENRKRQQFNRAPKGAKKSW